MIIWHCFIAFYSVFTCWHNTPRVNHFASCAFSNHTERTYSCRCALGDFHLPLVILWHIQVQHRWDQISFRQTHFNVKMLFALPTVSLSLFFSLLFKWKLLNYLKNYCFPYLHLRVARYVSCKRSTRNSIGGEEWYLFYARHPSPHGAALASTFNSSTSALSTK